MWTSKIPILITSFFCVLMTLQANNTLGTPKEDLDMAAVISVLTEYVKNWGFCYHDKYDNLYLINELELAEKKPSRDNPALIVVAVAEIEVLYQENLTLLQKYNSRKNHMKPACNKKAEGRLKFSTPVFSVDRLHALVLTETVCGANCGSIELLLFAKNQFGWYIQKRILKTTK